MTGSVLLLAPSRGLGGGIERCVSTIEAAFSRRSVPYHRLDLLRPGMTNGTMEKISFVREVRRLVRTGHGPVRLVLAHRNLLPVVPAVARHPGFAAATVILHGSEIWSGRRWRGHWLMRRPDVRVLAASAFSAGALARTCRAAVLHPGVTSDWYDTLVSAGEAHRPPETAVDHPAGRGAGKVSLVTTFRLASWRAKGLPTLLHAVRLLADERVRLTVCGIGPVPAELAAAVAPHPWCQVRPDLDDRELAAQLAHADLFVLGTRTRHGATGSGEGFGLALVEAQLAGVPVVAPAYGGSLDAYQRGLTGCAPIDETPQALAAVLAALLADDTRRTGMARAAAAWSRTTFDPAAYSGYAVDMILGQAQGALWNGG